MIDDWIRQEVNPFDRVNLKLGTFWSDDQEVATTVANIHQDVMDAITDQLGSVATDHRSRTILIKGDAGSGKSHLLTRLQRCLNHQAFFAYIGPWVDSQFIWRHVLRYTVDSLMQVPGGQTESQLIRWLKGLSAFTKRSLKQRIFADSVGGLLQSDRQKFIKHLKTSYKQANLYSSELFFGLLHDLTNPDLYPLVCEWLRGDDLSEEAMQALRVKHCVETEDDAKNILINISKIATDTQPIVLCFDNLDNIPRLDNGCQDSPALLNVNTMIHNENLKNFLVVISVITNTWDRNSDVIQQADQARIDTTLSLKRINLDQAKSLWAMQLEPLHRRVYPLPESAIFPLQHQVLERQFPSGKTLPRNVLLLGREQYQAYKMNLINPAPLPEPAPSSSQTSPTITDQTKTNLEPKPSQAEETPIPSTLPSPQPSPSPPVKSPLSHTQVQAEFQLLWQQEHQKMQQKILTMTLRSAPELIQMLLETLLALGLKGVQSKVLTGKYASYSMQYKHPKNHTKVGIVWTEDASMQSFYHVMSACQKAVGDRCSILHLLRAGSVGRPSLAGNKIYHQLFVHTANQHIQPSLTSVHDIATYHALVNAASAQELVLAGQTISVKDLGLLVRETEILQHCTLLQDLDVLPKMPAKKTDLQPVRDFILNLIITQQYIGRITVVENAKKQFPTIQNKQIDSLIENLCRDGKIQIVNPKEKPASQTICWVVTSPK